ncbi:DUF2971 domain-containing protein [Flavobacterium sp. 245]|uniref:DUF2971 domain-containing protein n=1 Tax=Flavobacterium sp. 245 TaxID=2512115 RepID=UPI0010620C23|nr:DUF2971 domain-containing protein [Flavobacterium sp. 245]TDP01554.1 DUF2971 family protein [Flavobacterium sp. 245]
MTKKVYFKYVTAERALQIISSKQIRFSQPNVLNDAFELLPTLDMEKIKEDYLKKTNNTDLKGLENFTLEITNTLFESYSTKGILSLSSSFEIQLMWAHYCQNYTGVVIGFDVEEGLIPSSYERYIFDKVKYSNKRFLYPNENPDSNLMFHKDKCWEYENEWRIVRPLKRLLQVKDGIYVSEFRPSAIRCVIYGPLINPNDRNSICKALNHPGYSHVGQYVSDLDDSNFEIDIDYLSSTFSDESSMVYNKEELTLRNFRETMLSKGKLFQAMGIISPDQKFNRFKDSIDLYTNEIID